MAKRRPSDLHVGLLCVHQLLDDFAQPLSGAHVPVTRPEQGGLSGGDPCLPARSFLCPVHQTPGGRARPLLERLVQGAHGVHALQTETEERVFRILLYMAWMWNPVIPRGVLGAIYRFSYALYANWLCIKA